MAKEILPWVLLGISLAIGATKLIFPKWIDSRLAIKLEGFRAEQQKDLEILKSEQQAKLDHAKADQQTELELMKHSLESRMSRIHEKEFEVLPQVCFLLNELHGCVAKVLLLTLERYPNFIGWSEEKLDRFLKEEDCGLSEIQEAALRSVVKTPKERQQYFKQHMESLNLDRAIDKRRLCRNYLIQNRVFIAEDQELRSKIEDAYQTLNGALASYQFGQEGDAEVMRSAQLSISSFQTKIDVVELAVQKRLQGLA